MNKKRIAEELIEVAESMNRHRKASRDIKAWSLNVASVSPDKARKYAEDEFSKAGQDMDDILPDFDKNYKALQKKMKQALNVPRIQMPVIEPSDMALFNKRLSEGHLDIFAPYAKGKLHTPKSLNKSEGEEWVELGFQDGEKSDDTVKAKTTGKSVQSLKPLQSQIWFDKLIASIIKFGPARSGSKILSQTVIVSADGYILDGHHRFGQAMLCDPSLKMKALYIPLKIDLLLDVGKTYGEAIGNKPKASERIAEELVEIASLFIRS